MFTLLIVNLTTRKITVIFFSSWKSEIAWLFVLKREFLFVVTRFVSFRDFQSLSNSVKLLLKRWKLSVKLCMYHVVSHEVHDSHVAKFTAFIVLKPPMEQLYQVDYTCVVSFCSNGKLLLPGQERVTYNEAVRQGNSYPIRTQFPQGSRIIFTILTGCGAHFWKPLPYFYVSFHSCSISLKCNGIPLREHILFTYPTNFIASFKKHVQLVIWGYDVKFVRMWDL